MHIAFILMIFNVFYLGVIGVVVNRHNVIIVMLSFELMYLSSNLLFAYSSYFTGNLLGLFYIMYVLTVVGAEACIGLSLVVLYSSINRQLDLNTLNLTKL